MLRIIVVSLLISSQAWAITPGQFWKIIIDHRSRIKAEMLKAFDRNPTRFSQLDRYTVSEFALLHDSAKARPQFIGQLMRYFGVNPKFLNSAERAQFENLKAEIAAAEAVEKNKFLMTVGPEAEAQLLELEQVAEVAESEMVRTTLAGGVSAVGSTFSSFVETAKPEAVEVLEDIEAILMVIK